MSMKYLGDRMDIHT
ncbi:hypothetical protein KBB05_03475 [Patescibacteria group bacterium]|nr:hypothetical protein [Patescibacteria group bacterium]